MEQNSPEQLEAVAITIGIKLREKGVDPSILDPIITKARNAKPLKEIRFMITDTKLSLSFTIGKDAGWIEETKWCIRLEK